jgi:hypothetical protein
LAASSAAPGSPGDVQAGDAQRAAGAGYLHERVEHRRGRSSAASAPWPRASNPTASTPQSTSGTPRICSIWSCGAPCDTSIVSQPKLWACSKPFLVQVADDDDGGAEQHADVAGGEADRAGTRDCRRSNRW